MTKCLIAGLPSAGKSTYIGALAYLLQNPIKDQRLILNQNPDDFTYLNKLIDPWLRLQKMDRTTRGFVNNIDLKLTKGSGSDILSVSLPDIAGEDYESIVQQNYDVIASWSENPDSLLLFINDLETNALEEQFGETEPDDKTQEPPVFNQKSMLNEVQNILLIKGLAHLFSWKRLAIGLSAWDKYSQDQTSPLRLLQDRAPFLYNFIMHYFPNTYIFGVSAQGDEYIDDEEKQNALLEKTENGTRAYVVDGCGNMSYDLTLPLNYLISGEK